MSSWVKSNRMRLSRCSASILRLRTNRSIVRTGDAAHDKYFLLFPVLTSFVAYPLVCSREQKVALRSMGILATEKVNKMYSRHSNRTHRKLKLQCLLPINAFECPRKERGRKNSTEKSMILSKRGWRGTQTQKSTSCKKGSDSFAGISLENHINQRILRNVRCKTPLSIA